MVRSACSTRKAEQSLLEIQKRLTLKVIASILAARLPVRVSISSLSLGLFGLYSQSRHQSEELAEGKRDDAKNEDSYRNHPRLDRKTENAHARRRRGSGH
jgi:hypothetical protein